MPGGKPEQRGMSRSGRIKSTVILPPGPDCEKEPIAFLGDHGG
jgi:hypothetical protein